MFLALAEALYNRFSWPNLARAVQSGLDGDGSALVNLADRYLGRFGGQYDNSLEMNIAVNCLDEAFSRDPAHYEDLTKRFTDAPRFGAALAGIAHRLQRDVVLLEKTAVGD